MESFTDNPLPLYFQILNDLRNKLKSGELPPNSMIPPEVILAEEYGVSRNTIRHAIGLLAKDGHLMRIPGKGTFVLDRRLDSTRIQWVLSSVEDMLQMTRQTRIDYGPPELLERVPAFVMRDLKLSTWNKAWLFRGLKYRNKELVSHLQTYLPYEIGAQIDQGERGQKTIFLYMEEKLGIDVTQIDQYMTIEPCTREDHEKLNNQACDYKVVIKRIFFSEDQPVELSFNHHPGDSFSLFYRMFKTR